MFGRRPWATSISAENNRLLIFQNIFCEPVASKKLVVAMSGGHELIIGPGNIRPNYFRGRTFATSDGQCYARTLARPPTRGRSLWCSSC